MRFRRPRWNQTIEITSWNEVSGAIGDSVTVLPIVVAVAVLSELSLAVMLIWFGIFQIVWGLYYGVPVSVEPMKALAALFLAGSVTTGEYLLAGILLGVILLVVGATNSLSRVERYIGAPVVRGIQLGVALVLLETGASLGMQNLWLAAVSIFIALVTIGLGYWRSSAFVVLLLGGVFAAYQTGLPSPTIPTYTGFLLFGASDLSLASVEATVAQLSMSIGNAALATSVLLSDYFGRSIEADELSASMGAMNLLALPLGALPMCHGSGGVAGKYAFGARTAGANLILGLLYVAIAIGAVGLISEYPLSMLGIILVIIALQLGRTSLRHAEAYPLMIGIGVVGVTINLGVAFVLGIFTERLLVAFDVLG